MYISEISTGAPENVAERVPLEQKVYKVFAKLGIPYERVDNDPASSMEESLQSEEDQLFPADHAGLQGL